MKLRDFDINLLVTLEAIWSTRSVSNAARTLNLAQPTISAALSRLRQTLGDELFVWSGTEMVPTPLTERLMPDVKQLLNGVHSIIGKSSGGIEAVERRFVIATADYVYALIGSELIERSAREAPHLSFDFVEMRPDIVNRSYRTEVDLFVYPVNALRAVGMERQALYRDKYVCIAAQGNDALRSDMSPREFIGLRHIGYSALPRTALSHEMSRWDNLVETANLSLTMRNYLALPHIVARSDAVAIVPRRIVTSLVSGLALKWIEPPLPVPALEMAALWRPIQGDDVALDWLCKTLVEICAPYRKRE